MPLNILYLHSHDTGRYVQPYGHPVSTPNLQALAEQGVLFRKAFAAAPTCSPSRAALLSGQWPHSTGMLGLAHRGFRMADYSRHLVQVLDGAGYHTALAGIQHEGTAGEIGYREVLPVGEPMGARERDLQTAAAAGRFLEGRSGQVEPFFLSVGFFSTHREWEGYSDEADARYVMPPAPLPDTPRTRADWAGFVRMAGELDEAMGRVLAALDASGLAGQTLVVCTTDHGIAFPDMKCNLTDHGLGVMLMLRGPGIGSGEVCDAMVSHVDLVPTICELTGIPVPQWADGVSLLPLLGGEVEQVHDQLFAEVTYHAAYEPMRCVRTDRWKYIRRFSQSDRLVRPNCDDGPSRRCWMEEGWAEMPVESEQLYDLLFDPQERRNLVGYAWNRPVLQDLRSRLAHWMESTGDPLLDGDVPPPHGARINLPEQDLPTDPAITAGEASADEAPQASSDEAP